MNENLYLARIIRSHDGVKTSESMYIVAFDIEKAINVLKKNIGAFDIILEIQKINKLVLIEETEISSKNK